MAHSNDEVEVDMITEQGMNDALAALEKADKSARYAKTLKAQLSRPPDKSDSPEVIHALRVAIAHGLVNPGGHVERVLRKRGFLDDPAIVGGYDFSEGTH